MEIEQEVALPDFVEERFNTSSQPRPHQPTLNDLIPVAGRAHRATIRRETNETRIVAVSLAHELSDIDLPSATHLRRARIAQVGVVCPHDKSRIAVSLEIITD